MVWLVSHFFSQTLSKINWTRFSSSSSVQPASPPRSFLPLISYQLPTQASLFPCDAYPHATCPPYIDTLWQYSTAQLIQQGLDGGDCRERHGEEGKETAGVNNEDVKEFIWREKYARMCVKKDGRQDGMEMELEWMYASQNLRVNGTRKTISNKE